jgi:alpha-ribazole phosphatase
MDRMSEILFIRHAETDLAGRFCGHTDPELNERGYSQISQLIDLLQTEKLEAVYASDLRRAHTTGKAIADAQSVDLRLRPSLREIDFGRWERLTWNEIEQLDKAYAQHWLALYPALPAPGGERFEDFENRILGELKYLTQQQQGRRIAVVTHAGVLRIVLHRFCGCSEEEAWEQTKSYCCIVRYNNVASSALWTAEVGS